MAVACGLDVIETAENNAAQVNERTENFSLGSLAYVPLPVCESAAGRLKWYG